MYINFITEVTSWPGKPIYHQTMPELGIVDIREIIRVVKSEYDYDFANYALTSLKQRLERLMALYGISTMESAVPETARRKRFPRHLSCTILRFRRRKCSGTRPCGDGCVKIISHGCGWISFRVNQDLAALLCFRRRTVFTGHSAFRVRIARQSSDYCQLSEPAKHRGDQERKL